MKLLGKIVVILFLLLICHFAFDYIMTQKGVAKYGDENTYKAVCMAENLGCEIMRAEKGIIYTENYTLKFDRDTHATSSSTYEYLILIGVKCDGEWIPAFDPKKTCLFDGWGDEYKIVNAWGALSGKWEMEKLERIGNAFCNGEVNVNRYSLNKKDGYLSVL